MIDDFNQFYAVVWPMLKKCQQGQSYQTTEINNAYWHLSQIQQNTKEAVLAVIPSFKQLMASCQIDNQ